MLFTRIRIEPTSDQPSPAQVMVNAATTAMDCAQFGLGLFAPYRMVLLMNGMNRAAMRALFITGKNVPR